MKVIQDKMPLEVNFSASSIKTGAEICSQDGNIQVVFIIHTNRSYHNIYQRDVAHDEYEVKRIFDTGVADFLFPLDIYSLKMDEIRTAQIKLFRKQIEES